jgi:hypothetical protein
MDILQQKRTDTINLVNSELNKICNDGLNNVDMGKNVYNSNTKKAILLIIEPYQSPDIFERPLEYNFNNKVENDILEGIDKGNTVENITNNIIKDGGVTPSTVPIKVNLSKVNKYRFVMIVDNDDTEIGLHELKNRILYIGYFSDEPLIRSTVNLTKPTYNFKSYLIFTRKTILTNNTFNAKKTNNLSLLTDDLNLNGNVNMYSDFSNSKNIRVSPITPGSLSETISISSNELNNGLYDDPVIIEGSDNLLSDIKRVNSNTQNPADHMNKLMGGLINTLALTVSDVEYGFTSDIELQINDELDKNIINRALENITNEEDTRSNLSNISGINKPTISLGELMSKYPNIDVKFVKVQDHNQLDILNTIKVDSLTTKYSNLIMNCLSSIMISLKISGLSFRYNSYQNINDPNRLAGVKWNSISLIDNTANDVILKNRMVHFIRYANNKILDHIYRMTKNHYEFEIVLNINGKSYIALNFYDRQNLNGLTVKDNVLNNFANNIVGSSNHFTKNAMQLSNLVKSSASDIIGGINSIPDGYDYNLMNDSDFSDIDKLTRTGGM